jgi:hypothetical protein
MTVQCLKSESGSMVKLVKYSLKGTAGGNSGLNKGVASVLDDFENNHAEWDTPVSKIGANTSQVIGN